MDPEFAYLLIQATDDHWCTSHTEHYPANELLWKHEKKAALMQFITAVACGHKDVHQGQSDLQGFWI